MYYENFENVIFTDESTVELDNNNRCHYYKYINELCTNQFKVERKIHTTQVLVFFYFYYTALYGI